MLMSQRVSPENDSHSMTHTAQILTCIDATHSQNRHKNFTRRQLAQSFSNTLNENNFRLRVCDRNYSDQTLELVLTNFCAFIVGIFVTLPLFDSKSPKFLTQG